MSSGITILIVFRLRAENGTKNLHNFVIAILPVFRYNSQAFDFPGNTPLIERTEQTK